MMDTVALTKVKEVYAKHGFTLIEMDTRSLTTEVTEILKRCFDALKIDGGLAAVLSRTRGSPNFLSLRREFFGVCNRPPGYDH
jgi:hypothetical protein